MIHQVQTGAQIKIWHPAKRIEAAKGIEYYIFLQYQENQQT